MIQNTYQVDFTDMRRDFVALANARLLEQFQNKPLLEAVLAVLVKPFQEVYDAITAGSFDENGVRVSQGMMEARTLFVAQSLGQNDENGIIRNNQLEAIGRIVGQGRDLAFTGENIYFTPDTPSEDYPANPDIPTVPLGADIGRAWVPGALDSGVQPASDDQYALQILGRIYSNMNRFSSVPEVQQMVKESLGLDVWFEITGPMAVNCHIINSALASQDAILKLQEFRDGVGFEQKYFVPFAATLDVTFVKD